MLLLIPYKLYTMYSLSWIWIGCPKDKPDSGGQISIVFTRVQKLSSIEKTEMKCLLSWDFDECETTASFDLRSILNDP